MDTGADADVVVLPLAAGRLTVPVELRRRDESRQAWRRLARVQVGYRGALPPLTAAESSAFFAEMAALAERADAAWAQTPDVSLAQALGLPPPSASRQPVQRQPPPPTLWLVVFVGGGGRRRRPGSAPSCACCQLASCAGASWQWIRALIAWWQVGSIRGHCSDWDRATRSGNADAPLPHLQDRVCTRTHGRQVVLLSETDRVCGQGAKTHRATRS